jgi:hypothetical protein
MCCCFREGSKNARAEAAHFQTETQKNADLLKKEQEAARTARSQEAARRGVITRRIQECNQLEDEKKSLSEKVKQQELGQVKSQLANAESEKYQALDIIAGDCILSATSNFLHDFYVLNCNENLLVYYQNPSRICLLVLLELP